MVYNKMDLSYKKFLILESKKVEKDFIISDKFKKAISGMENEISDMLLTLNKSEVTYVDATDRKDMVSFLPSTKINDPGDKWKDKNRQEIKVGRFVKKVLGDLPHTEVEKFVNDYKAAMEYSDYEDRFKIVEGEDMVKYYYRANQILKGSLYHSCMGGSEQRPFIRSFFAENPKTIKMLVLFDDYDKDKIIGRANIWYLDEPSDRIFMDRIYTTEDYLVNIFIKYAVNNDYIYKSRQIYGGNVVPVIIDGSKKSIIMKASMDPKEYSYYPYVDTLQFYNKKTGEITNDTSKWEQTGDGEWLGLLHAGGGYLTKDNDGGFKMDYMGRLIHPHFVKRSKIDKCWIHQSDAVYLEYLNDYCVPERDIVEIDGKNYLKEDTIYDEETKTYKRK
jgi:hypothetical protein